ncbi:transmembrane cell adhesion receptor mua-3-like isoform X2 [Mya arenaria]|nr:transmembrane cell adhesion receptor mua-3-like isoform X2 [Mya arenaria]
MAMLPTSVLMTTLSGAGVCNCVSTHYDNNGDISGGECDKRKQLGEICTSHEDCTSFNKKTMCGSARKCQCRTNYYDSDGNVNVGGTCISKKKLGEDCSTNKDCTSSDSNSECHGRKCQCQSSYYDGNGNTGGGTCASKVNLEGSCTAATLGSGDPCNTAFAVCTGSESFYTCKCRRGYYKSGGNTCSKVGVALGSSCTIPTTERGPTITDACRITFAECRATSDSLSTCQCTATHYSSGPECRQRQQLGEICSSHEDCSSFDTNSICGHGRTCQCQTNYYDSDGSINNGGTCLSKVGLGSACPRPDACKPTYSICSKINVCICDRTHYDNNGVNVSGGDCYTSK